MRRVRRVAGVGLALCSLLLAPAGVSLAQDGSGTIEGRVVNGTFSDGAADVEAVLHAFRDEVHAEDVPIRSAPDGGFAFPALETAPAYSYEVTASYGGVNYGSAPVRFGSGEPVQRLEVTVYEPTDSDPGLRVRRANVLLNSPDPATQTLQAIEVVTLENPADRTFQPSASGPAGPMGLLRFPLPPQAGDLRLGPGLDGAEVVQVDRGFATSRVLLPGSTEVVFAYRIPYGPGQPLAWERRTPYPTAELRVLVPSEGLVFESPELQEAAPVQLAGRGYRLYTVQNLEAGGRIGFTVRGLPGRWPFGLPLDSVPAFAWGALGATLAVALAAGFAVRARRRSSLPSEESDGAEPLAGLLVALEDEFADGRLSAGDYRARRAEMMAQLAPRLRARGMHRVATTPSGVEGDGALEASAVTVEDTRCKRDLETVGA